MLYVLHGSLGDKVREKARGLVGSLRRKKPGATLITVSTEQFDERALDELCFGQGLFERKHIIVFDNVLQDSDAREAVLRRIKDIAGSDNIFIFLDGVLTAPTVAKLSRHAERVQAFSGARQLEKAAFNVFLLADALGTRDRKHLWVLYHKAKMHGISDEEINGVLFWQAKTLVVAGKAANAADAGLSPFVFKKARGFLRHWSAAESASLSAMFLALYHDARRGQGSLDTALERAILRLPQKMG